MMGRAGDLYLYGALPSYEYPLVITITCCKPHDHLLGHMIRLYYMNKGLYVNLEIRAKYSDGEELPAMTGQVCCQLVRELS